MKMTKALGHWVGSLGHDPIITLSVTGSVGWVMGALL
jgi:hypothetical protein